MMEDRIGGQISETAWVVPDLEAAIENWLALGYGPFFTMRLDCPEVLHRGATVSLQLDIALTIAGGVQIELIQQRNDGPSAYRDIYAKGEGGFHHIRHAPGQYDAMRKRLVDQGIEIAMEMAFGPQRIFYADTRALLGCMLEVLDPAPVLDVLGKMMTDAVRHWDGSDPVRAIDLSKLG